MGKPKRTTIENYSLLHFAERAKERYNVVLEEKDYKIMNKDISDRKKNNEQPLGQDKLTEVYRVVHKDVSFLCVWNKADACITTLLPKDTVVKPRK